MREKKSFIKNPYFRTGIPIIILIVACYLIFSYSSSIFAGMFQVLSLLLAILFIKKGLGEPFLFNPYLFFSICPLSLALYFPAVSEYYLLKFDDKTYVFALCNMAMFFMGLEVFKDKKIKIGSTVIGSKNRWPDLINESFVAKMACFFTIVGIMPACYALMKGSFSNWSTLKEFASDFPLYAVIAYFPYIGVYLAIRSKKKKTMTLALVLGAIASIVALTKTMVMFYIISILAAYEKKNGRNGTRKLIILGLISMLIFSYFDNLYNSIRDASQYEALWLSRSSSLLSMSQLKSYLYFETPWCNLQYLLNNMKEHTNGLWALNPFLTLFGMKGYFVNIYDSLQSYTTFNALGYLIYLYSDFGYVGACVAVFFLGGFVSYIYVAGLHTENPFWGVINMFMLRAVMMMFFNLHFNTEIYFLTALLMMVVLNSFARKHYSR